MGCIFHLPCSGWFPSEQRESVEPNLLFMIYSPGFCFLSEISKSFLLLWFWNLEFQACKGEINAYTPQVLVPMSCPGHLKMPVWLGYGNNSDVHCCLGRSPVGCGCVGSPLLGGWKFLQVQPSLGPKLYLERAYFLTHAGIWHSVNLIRLFHKPETVMVVYSTCSSGRLVF